MSWKYKQICGLKGNPMANKNGVVLEHRLVVAKKLGRPLKTEELVHHENENQQDNDPFNLKLTNRGDHAKRHCTTGRTYVEITCAFCGKLSKKEARQVIPKQKKGQKDFYCNRSCMARHFGVGRNKPV